MSRKRTSPIWFLASEEFASLIKNSENTTQTLAFFGLRNVGGNNRTLWARIEEENLDTSHFRSVENWRKLSKWRVSAAPLETVLVEHSTYSRSSLRARLIKDDIIPYICAICDMLPVWKGRSLSLRLDHINGIYNDNRLNNIRFVCPNCDSQLPTFSGRNKRQNRPKYCVDCFQEIENKKHKRCDFCTQRRVKETHKGNPTNQWPPDDEFLELFKTTIDKQKLADFLKVGKSSVYWKYRKIMEARLMAGHGALNTRMVGFDSPASIQVLQP